MMHDACTINTWPFCSWAAFLHPYPSSMLCDFNLSQRDLSFNGAGSWFLAHRAAAPIKAGGRKFERYAGFNVTLREVISVDQPGNLFLPGAGLTVPAHNHIWPRLIPRKSQLPPPLRRVLQGLGRWRHASMGSARR